MNPFAFRAWHAAPNSQPAIRNLVYLVLLGVALAGTLSSCSKKPAESYDDGMKAIAAGDFNRAQECFADGIKHDGDVRLYAGFIAADLVTGKYPGVISAYNALSDDIHTSLVRMYSARLIKVIGISSEIIPYKTSGGNRIPADFPETITIQLKVDFQQYLTVKQQIENAIHK